MAKTIPKKSTKTVVTHKKARKGRETYNTFIFRVLRQVHPGTRISKKGMMIVNNFVTDTFDRIATEAGRLCRMHKTMTLGSRDVQCAIRLVLPGELSKHAVSEGTKAMTKFTQA